MTAQIAVTQAPPSAAFAKLLPIQSISGLQAVSFAPDGSLEHFCQHVDLKPSLPSAKRPKHNAGLFNGPCSIVACLRQLQVA